MEQALSNNKRQEKKEFQIVLEKYQAQYTAAKPYSRSKKLSKKEQESYLELKRYLDKMKNDDCRTLIKGFIDSFNSNVLLENSKSYVTSKGQYLLDLLDRIEKGETHLKPIFFGRFQNFSLYCITENLKQPSTTRPIIVPLKKFSDGVSIRLLTDLINDENRHGVVIDTERHGVRQPKTLYDFFRNHREKFIMPESYVLHEIIIEDGKKLKLAIPKDTIILREK